VPCEPKLNPELSQNYRARRETISAAAVIVTSGTLASLQPSAAKLVQLLKESVPALARVV